MLQLTITKVMDLEEIATFYKTMEALDLNTIDITQAQVRYFMEA